MEKLNKIEFRLNINYSIIKQYLIIKLISDLVKIDLILMIPRLKASDWLISLASLKLLFGKNTFISFVVWLQYKQNMLIYILRGHSSEKFFRLAFKNVGILNSVK